MTSGSAAPSVPFSPWSGPALVLVDDTEAVLQRVATSIGEPSIIGPRPTRVLEGTFADDRVLGLFRTADVEAANAELESLSTPLGGFRDVRRITVGHHALGEDAPPATAERGLAYLMVHGFVSNRDVYGAYLRGLKASGLLTTHGCERILMMGPSNVRTIAAGAFVPGEYFEVLSFPSATAIEAFWLSDVYAPLIAVRQGTVDVCAAIFPPG
jgi:uncharacterized protein (DUF1330 family)